MMAQRQDYSYLVARSNVCTKRHSYFTIKTNVNLMLRKSNKLHKLNLLVQSSTVKTGLKDLQLTSWSSLY